MSELSLLVVGIILLVASLAFINRRRNALVAKIPGPALFVPLFGSMLEILVRALWIQDVVELGSILTQKYGSVYALWTGHTPYVIVSNAEDAQVVLTNPAVADKGKGYHLVAPWLGDGLLLAGGQKWQARRKVIGPAFGIRVLEKFTDVFNKHATTMEDKMRLLVDQGPFDVVRLLSLCSLDVICETAMGVQVNAQNQEDSDYVKAVKTSCQCFFNRQIYPWLQFETALRMSSTGWKFNNAIKVLHGMTNRVIQQRKKEIIPERDELSEKEDDVGLKQRAVLLDHLLTKSVRREGITDQDITDEVNTFLFAGHDTTTASLAFTLHLLAKHQGVQEAVFREVQEVVGDSVTVTPEHLSDLKYLECVIKESLRLYPSVPVIVRDCKQEFTLASGYTIPVGAQVGVNIVFLHRDPTVFPRPLEFDPDRFLPDAVQGRHHFAYLPFSAAQRNCIGQRFAMAEMKTILSRLVRAFRILSPSDDYRLWLRTEIVLGSRDGVHVQLQLRTD